MEFKGVGILPYEPPAESLKPFFRRKFKTIFRSVATSPGFIHQKELVKTAKTVSARYPEEKRQEVQRVHLEEVWPYYFHLHGKDSIDEDEYVDMWMKRVFADAESRKSAMQESRKHNVHLFDYIDTSRNGLIEFEEFLVNYKCYGITEELAHLIFAAIDFNNDKEISFDEFSHGLVNLYFCSGHDSIISVWCGQIVD